MTNDDRRNRPEGIAGFDSTATAPETDWSDPTHIPHMVFDAVFEIGNLPDCLSDDDQTALELAALDAMPRGREAVIEAVQKRCRELAAAGDWSDWLYEPGTSHYPWE